jgi:DNA-directed RNA polymerase subunit L
MSKSKSIKSIKPTKSDLDINLKLISHTKRSEWKSSSLEVEFTGKDLNFKIINTLSRVCSNNIPTYAFPTQTIKIEENTSAAFDTQYLQLRLSQLPIYDLELDLDFLEDSYLSSIVYEDINRQKHPLEKDIKIYINEQNNTNQISYVSTNNIRYYIDGEQLQPYDKTYPILITKLRPNDSFKCTMTAAIGTGEVHTIWRAASNSYALYNEDETKYNLTINSRGQLTEYDILIKASKHILKRLDRIQNYFNLKVREGLIENDSTLLFIIDGEDHTMGEVINYELQSHPNLSCGVSKPDLLIKSITFKIIAENPAKMVDSINECFDSLKQKYLMILEGSERLVKK